MTPEVSAGWTGEASSFRSFEIEASRRLEEIYLSHRISTILATCPVIVRSTLRSVIVNRCFTGARDRVLRHGIFSQCFVARSHIEVRSATHAWERGGVRFEFSAGRRRVRLSESTTPTVLRLSYADIWCF